MTCRELAEVLVDYVSGELEAEHAERIRGHMEQCPPCVHYIATYQLTITITRRLPQRQMSPQLADRIKHALEQADRPES